MSCSLCVVLLVCYLLLFFLLLLYFSSDRIIAHLSVSLFHHRARI